jgi:methionyl-tRNA formyltransferase
LIISCGDKSIKILEIQRQGKNIQKVNEFITGSKIKKGNLLI